jgi:tRNA threonylcarbamoyladenosine biosynthesis protein TsaB
VIIAIDGTSTDLSLAVAEQDGTLVGDEAWSSEQRQSSELLPRLLQLLDRHGHRVDEVTAIAVGSGPGSFTGLRVAMALAKGIAFALRRPIVAVPSLLAWLESEPAAVAAVARAGAREAYVQLRGDAEPAIADRDVLAERLGDRIVVAPDELAGSFGLPGAVPPRAAAVIARLAADRLAVDPAGDDLRRLEPRYLRAPRGVDSPDAGAIRWH